MSRIHARFLLPLLLLLTCSPRAQADDVRFVSLRPAGPVGSGKERSAAVDVGADGEAAEPFDGYGQGPSRPGIRVVLDIPLNHASAGYDRAAGDPDKLKPRATGPRQEAEKLWDSWGSGYRYWDFDNAPTRRFLKNAALFWLTKEDVDGLREVLDGPSSPNGPNRVSSAPWSFSFFGVERRRR